MPNKDTSIWLDWARELQAISQTGLTYSLSNYDTQRYTRLRDIAAQIVAHQTSISRTEALENFSIQPGYATAKIDVRGAVIRDNKILLVQERRDQCWCMPGGWADVGDIPSDMVAREVLEESGFVVKPVKVIGVFDANRRDPMEFFYAYKIVFLCDILRGEPTPSDETAAVDFFDFDNLPPLSQDRTNQRHLTEIMAHLQDPARATTFD
jgi:ADP-ribose pyrophosphatase YjhB (NUDIX family)